MTYIFLSRHTLFQNVVHSSILSSLCIAPIYILISFSFSPLFSSLFPFSLLTYTPQTYYISHIFMISYPSLHLSFLPHLSLSFSSIFQSLTQFFYFYKSLFLSLNSTYLFISSSLSLFISPSLTLSLSHSLTFSLSPFSLPLSDFLSILSLSSHPIASLRHIYINESVATPKKILPLKKIERPL